jgi:hypothetical protein
MSGEGHIVLLRCYSKFPLRVQKPLDSAPARWYIDENSFRSVIMQNLFAIVNILIIIVGLVRVLGADAYSGCCSRG